MCSRQSRGSRKLSEKVVIFREELFRKDHENCTRILGSSLIRLLKRAGRFIFTLDSKMYGNIHSTFSLEEKKYVDTQFYNLTLKSDAFIRGQCHQNCLRVGRPICTVEWEWISRRKAVSDFCVWFSEVDSLEVKSGKKYSCSSTL